MLCRFFIHFFVAVALLMVPSISLSFTLCPIDQNSSFDNCLGSYSFKNEEGLVEATYTGRWKDDKKHGFGAQVGGDGDVFVGNFHDNKRDGLGIYVFPGEDTFVGSYKDGVREGIGAYYYSTGSVFVGAYKNNKRHGLGIIRYDDEAVFIGTFANGEMEGKATFIFPNGDTYIGPYKAGSWNGVGGQILKSGAVFAGNFKEGERNGLGYYIWKDGEADVCAYNMGTSTNCSGSNVYDVAPVLMNAFRNLTQSERKKIQKQLGSIGLYNSTVDGKWGKNTFSGLALYSAIHLGKDNFNDSYSANVLFKRILALTNLSQTPCPTDTAATWRNCVARYTDESGASYYGQWLNDERNGMGVYVDSDGNIFTGEYNESIRDGIGATIFSDGDIYVGTFEDGERKGLGKYSFADGNSYLGNWSKGDPNGLGTYLYQNGDVFVGEYIDGDRHGTGVYTHADGNVFRGKYLNDKRHGHGTYIDEDGEVTVGIWENGEFQDAPTNTTEAVPSKKEEAVDPEEIREVASGTGFFVSTEGHIITNQHVIEGCTSVKVKGKGNFIPTVILAEDKQNDLALLRISESPDFVFALSSLSPYPLQEIIVAGFPFGDRYSSTLKFTKGIISSLAGLGDNYSELQIDAALQQGNSGGPIIDEFGNVVAVAVSKLDAKYMFDNFGVIPENTNFGVKASAVRNLLDANLVEQKAAGTDVISKRDLSKYASEGTVYLSCLMNNEQFVQMQNKRVMLENVD